MKVPDRLRAVVGKTKLVEPLHTNSLAEANRLRWPVINRFRELLEKAEPEARQKAGQAADPLIEQALEWNQDFRKAQADPEHGAEFDDEGQMEYDGVTVLGGFISSRAIEIAEVEGGARASLFHGIAMGTATPLGLPVETWLTQKTIKPKQVLQYRRSVKKLEAHLSKTSAGAVELVTRRVAGGFVQSLVEEQTHPRTINKYVSALSSYWKWLRAKGYVETNVWLEQAVPNPVKTRATEPRPFTEDEMLTLLHGDAPVLLMDVMLVAALSGMRIEEVARVKVGDLKDGCFDVHVSKTKAGERMVPVHSGLNEVIKRRSLGKADDQYLFDELPEIDPLKAGERSGMVSKQFMRYRRRLDVDDHLEGARQSRVTFHSFRRWFITQAEMAGVGQNVIASVVGHARQGMTLGTYSGGPGFDLMRACVEQVKLPMTRSGVS